MSNDKLPKDDYEFVTREEIIDIVVADAGGIELRQLALRLLSEREAYREAAINVWRGKVLVQTWSGEELDAEARRILVGGK